MARRLVHIVEAQLTLLAAALWLLGVRVLHEAVLEDLLAKAEQRPTPAS